MRAVVKLVVVAAAAWSIGVLAQKHYGPGVTDTEIRIGQTMPYSGPASAYATQGKATNAYFLKLNAEGGINGRQIKLISLDDSYSRHGPSNRSINPGIALPGDRSGIHEAKQLKACPSLRRCPFKRALLHLDSVIKPMHGWQQTQPLGSSLLVHRETSRTIARD